MKFLCTQNIYLGGSRSFGTPQSATSARRGNVKALFDLKNPKDIAPALADLIIERQLQKIATRRKYSGGGDKL